MRVLKLYFYPSAGGFKKEIEKRKKSMWCYLLLCYRAQRNGPCRGESGEKKKYPKKCRKKSYAHSICHTKQTGKQTGLKRRGVCPRATMQGHRRRARLKMLLVLLPATVKTVEKTVHAIPFLPKYAANGTTVSPLGQMICMISV